MQRIIAIYRTKEKYGWLTDKPNFAATRKEHQCPYRLLKVQFSYILKNLHSLGIRLIRLDLTLKKSSNQIFWDGVQEVFEGQDEVCNDALCG